MDDCIDIASGMPPLLGEEAMAQDRNGLGPFSFWPKGGKLVAKLSYKKRQKLPSKAFAIKGRRYPINDPAHAKNALARVSQHGSPQEKAEVRRKVHAKFPGIAVSGLKKGKTKAKKKGRKRVAGKG